MGMRLCWEGPFRFYSVTGGGYWTGPNNLKLGCGVVYLNCDCSTRFYYDLVSVGILGNWGLSWESQEPP